MAKKENSFIKEFKDFISKGNVLDMAVGVIIGGAFGSIITSMVNDIFTPLLSLLTNKVDLSSLRIILTPATEEVAENAIRYGAFLQNVINFVFQALIVFIFVKAVNKLTAAAKAKELAEQKAKAEEEAAKKAEADAEAAKKAEEPVELLREILAQLKKD